MTFLGYILVGIFMALKVIASGFIYNKKDWKEWAVCIAVAVINLIAWPLNLVYLIGMAVYLRTRKPPKRLDLVMVDRT